MKLVYDWTAVVAGILGFTAQNATARAYVESQLIQANASKFNSVLTAAGCYSTAYIPAFAGQDIFADYFIGNGNLWNAPEIAPLVEQSGVM